MADHVAVLEDLAEQYDGVGVTHVHEALLAAIAALSQPVAEAVDVYEQIVRRVAATPDGCIVLAKLISRELDFIDKCISDAIRRCEADKSRWTGEGHD